MSEPIKSFSCNLSHSNGEQHGRTFSSGTADGINYVTNGAIPDENSDVAHGLMFAAGAALATSATNKSGNWLAAFFFLFLLIIIFWSFGQKPEAARRRPAHQLCPPRRRAFRLDR